MAGWRGVRAATLVLLVCAIGSSNADSRGVTARGTESSRLRARQEVPLGDRASFSNDRKQSRVIPLSRRTSRVLGGATYNQPAANNLVTGLVKVKSKHSTVAAQNTDVRENTSKSTVNVSVTNDLHEIGAGLQEQSRNAVGSQDLNEAFPYLDENYDYTNYYYDYDLVPEQSIAGSTSRPAVSTQATPSTATVVSDFNNAVNKESKANMKRNFVPVFRRGNRFAFKAAGSRKISHVSEKQVPTTKNPPIKTDEVEDKSVKTRAATKDDFMFKFFPRNKKNSSISLHERLQIHLKGDSDPAPTHTPHTTTSTTEIPVSTTQISTSTRKHKLISSPSQTSSAEMHKPVALALQASPAVVSLDSDSSHGFGENSFVDTSTSAQETVVTTTPDVTTELDETTTMVVSTTSENIKTNVTFSTRKTQQVADPYPDILSLSLLESQLGRAPSGVDPFGEEPFGEEPFGEKPFGEQPEGYAPLGHHSLAALINQTSPSSGKNGTEGRYHVQVTAPNGSINGDYIVVDPATGNLNGVRYEAAKDVDPLLVQKALLNFLSLDPSTNVQAAAVHQKSMVGGILDGRAPALTSSPELHISTTTIESETESSIATT